MAGDFEGRISKVKQSRCMNTCMCGGGLLVDGACCVPADAVIKVCLSYMMQPNHKCQSAPMGTMQDKHKTSLLSKNGSWMSPCVITCGDW